MCVWCACSAQVCAKHVRLHNYYNTSADPMGWQAYSGQVTPTGACGPVYDVALWFGGVPEWLDGDASVASADWTRNVTFVVGGVTVPTAFAQFVAYGYVGNTGMPYDAYFWYACTQPSLCNAAGCLTVCVVPSNPVYRPDGKYDLVYNRNGCVDTAQAVFPQPTNLAISGDREVDYFIPRFSTDRLDPCEWTCDVPGCGPDSLTQGCFHGSPVHDPDLGRICEAPTPFETLYVNSECCSCPAS